jgi:hypothetical protein
MRGHPFRLQSWMIAIAVAAPFFALCAHLKAIGSLTMSVLVAWLAFHPLVALFFALDVSRANGKRGRGERTEFLLNGDLCFSIIAIDLGLAALLILSTTSLD